MVRNLLNQPHPQLIIIIIIIIIIINSQYEALEFVFYQEVSIITELSIIYISSSIYEHHTSWQV